MWYFSLHWQLPLLVPKQFLYNWWNAYQVWCCIYPSVFAYQGFRIKYYVGRLYFIHTHFWIHTRFWDHQLESKEKDYRYGTYRWPLSISMVKLLVWHLPVRSSAEEGAAVYALCSRRAIHSGHKTLIFDLVQRSLTVNSTEVLHEVLSHK